VTELAYLADLPSAYVRSFRARVVALPPGGVVLDRTYFYPTGGGQPADHGALRSGDAEYEVLDVTKSGPSVVHRVRGVRPGVAPLAVDAAVDGTIDWERRHQHMRLHTGQHLLSALAFDRTGLRTRKAVLRGATATIDLEAEVAPSVVDELAGTFAAAIDQPRAVRVRHVPRSEWEAFPTAGRSGLVPLPPQVDPVRVIEIDGLDACPCGGTHVRSTAEIGAVRLAPPSRAGDGGSRLGFTLVRTGATTPPE
jgi:misacylated tRNA(Ala) deacylase